MRPSGVGSSMPAAIWSFRGRRRGPGRTRRGWSRRSRRTWPARAVGCPAPRPATSTRSLNSSQLSSRLRKRSSNATLVRQHGRHLGSPASSQPSPSGSPSSHSSEMQLPLGVAIDPLAVAAELGVVAGQQHQPGQRPGPELVEHLAFAPVAVDLPMRRDRPEVDDAGVSLAVVGSTTSVIGAECTGRSRARSSASRHDEMVTGSNERHPDGPEPTCRRRGEASSCRSDGRGHIFTVVLRIALEREPNGGSRRQDMVRGEVPISEQSGIAFSSDLGAADVTAG